LTVFDEILDVLRARKIAFVERLTRIYICSVGAHIINLENKKRKFYLVMGRVADLRVHIFFIAPSGFFKSEVLYQLLDDETGVVSGTRMGTAFEGGMTAAAFVGTVKLTKNGEASIETGAAWIHRETIVGIEEFAEITNMMKQMYNVQMADALLTALDKGWVRKRLARSGEKGIHYPTNLSMWTGSQPTRLDLGAGIGRRFYMQEFIPTREEREVIAEHRRKGRGVSTSPQRVMKIKNLIEQIIEKVEHLNYIEFTAQIDSFLQNYKLIHFEEELFERIAIGYNVMIGNFDDVLLVRLTPELREIIEQGIAERRSVKMGSDINQVTSILKDFDGEMTVSEMMYELANFSIDGRAAYKLINAAANTGRISMVGNLLTSKWQRAKK